MIDPAGPVPVYEQLANLLEQQIRAGRLRPNRPLPSEASLQQQYGVSRGTVRHAVAVLRDRGLVFTVPHRGTYVSPPANA